MDIEQIKHKEFNLDSPELRSDEEMQPIWEHFHNLRADLLRIEKELNQINLEQNQREELEKQMEKVEKTIDKLIDLIGYMIMNNYFEKRKRKNLASTNQN